MKRHIFLGVSFFLCVVTGASADTVYLKNGKAVKGELLSETKYSVKIMINKFPETFYWDQIDRVEREDDKPVYGTSDEKVSEKKKELLLHLIDINGDLERIKSDLRSDAVSFPLRWRKRLDERLNEKELAVRVAYIYAKYFTEQEIEEMIRFYDSPVGQKEGEVGPDAIDEGIEAANLYIKELEKGDGL